MPRMAFQNALNCQPRTFEEAVFVHGFNAIVGAARIEPAALPQKGANAELVQTDEFDQQKSQHYMIC